MSFSFIATQAVIIGLAALVYALSLSTWRYGARAQDPARVPAPLSADFGPALTSRRLRLARWIFALGVLAALGLHAYWALFASGPLGENEEFSLLKSRRDQRTRREVESDLRGWVFDRHKDHRRTLAKYRYLNGQIIRDYPLGPAASHLIGYSGLLRGDALIERALGARLEKPEDEKSEGARNWWRRLLPFRAEQPVVIGRDLTLTIDYELQKDAFAQLGGKRGAIVLLNPQTGEVYALASAPSFPPDDVNNDVRWREISSDVKNRPLLNRALHEYYLPGSTLKTLTAAAALETRLDQYTFNCQAAGWTPPGSGRPIRDDEGEAHGRLNLADAFTHSCNQYFSQLGVEIERQRLSEAARRFGVRVFATPGESYRAGFFRHLWNTDNQILSDVLSPLNSTFVAGSRITKYDLALESIGQGYVQLTTLQMALIAAAAGNLGGQVMKPQIELGRAPEILSQAMTAESAARLRAMMGSVVARGTARGAFSSIDPGLKAGGKTGTAQREVPVIDPRTNRPVTYRDGRGRERVRKEFRIDSWFIGLAPIESPVVAIAVVVESGGYGGRTAAPIAARLLARAQSLGLFSPQRMAPPESARR
jgi:cell division protein FtsI/penicillin-binding protein 2